jgi:hypothetical protein
MIHWPAGAIMSLTEGFRRMKVVGRAVLFIGLVLVIIGVAGIYLNHLYGTYGPLQIMVVIGVIGLYLSILGAIAWLGIWIAQGFFLAPKTPPQ